MNTHLGRLLDIGCFRRYVRVHHLPYYASCALDRWHGHHHELGDLYHCTLPPSEIWLVLIPT
jgi:hypothetical protein